MVRLEQGLPRGEEMTAGLGVLCDKRGVRQDALPRYSFNKQRQDNGKINEEFLQGSRV